MRLLARRGFAASLITVVATMGSLVVGIAAPTVASATSFVPTQFIAKVYTEGLGRAPDPAGWNNAVNFFNTAPGCTPARLTSFVAQTLNDAAGTEFGNLGYNKSEKAIVLFRSMLNRDADTTGFQSYRDYINTNGMVSAVNSIGGGTEFQNLANNKICAGPSDYDWGGTLPSPTPDTGAPGAAKTNVDLQNALNANAGGQVTLSSRDVYILNAPITIPANTKLYTFFGPPPTGYAKLARLVVSPFMAFNTTTRAAITLQPGAQISNVWIDGGRTFRSDCRSNGTPGVTTTSPVPIETLGGPGTQAMQVTNNKIGNTCGGTSVSVLDTGIGVPSVSTACTTATPTVVSGNLIEAYSSEHDNSARQSDGISVHCRATTVTSNSIIDPTDGGIVLFSWSAFGAPTAPGQQSQITSNTILSLGQGAWYGLAADALFVKNATKSASGDAPGTAGVSFVGAHMDNNTLWTSSTGSTAGAGSADGHMDTVLSVGTHVLFGSRTGTAAMSGTDYVAGRNGNGIVVNNNTSAGQVTRVQVAFIVSGMFNATVTGNNFPAIQMVVSGPCNSGHAVVHTTAAGYASVNFAGLPSWDDTALTTDHCINSLA